MMDNGFVTGSNGKKADCRNVILILTTNAGAANAEKNAIGFGAQTKDYTDADLKKFFAPEFRNRLDAVVTFNKLEKDTMVKIVTKFIGELKDQVKDKSIKVTASVKAIDWLIDKGFDPKMGARPLQRVIDKEIKRPLSRMMLFGDLKNGGTVSITVVNDKIELVVKSKALRLPLLPAVETVDDNN
jgi:ATP-dependent Clp protease ATP-binding subunit ClpA